MNQQQRSYFARQVKEIRDRKIRELNDALKKALPDDSDQKRILLSKMKENPKKAKEDLYNCLMRELTAVDNDCFCWQSLCSHFITSEDVGFPMGNEAYFEVDNREKQLNEEHKIKREEIERQADALIRKAVLCDIPKELFDLLNAFDEGTLTAEDIKKG